MGPPPSNEPPKYVVLRAVGGEIGAASALAPKIGPLGLVSFILFFDSFNAFPFKMVC